MNGTSSSLPGIKSDTVKTSRLTTIVLSAGVAHGEPVLFLHGNLSGANIWEETMLALPDRYFAVAPDQRGYGGSDSAVRIDATRGFADWSEDVIALADAYQWAGFHVVGHSLGACVLWSLLGRYAARLRTVTLVAPGPPSGFPGGHGERGTINYPDGAGSGAGLVNSRLVERLKAGDRESSDQWFSPREVMNRVYWKPPFRPAREEQLLTTMLQVHLGQEQFPGDVSQSPHWPGFAPGRFGPINALSPRYNQHVLDELVAARPKPRLLWIQGSDDAIVSDHSLSDPGRQGQLGLRPDWPGVGVFPPQPLLAEVKFALDQYELHGGSVIRQMLADVGHTPFLERPEEFQTTLANHLGG